MTPNDKIVDVATDMQDGSIKLMQLAVVLMFVRQNKIASRFLIAATLLGTQSIVVISKAVFPAKPKGDK